MKKIVIVNNTELSYVSVLNYIRRAYESNDFELDLGTSEKMEYELTDDVDTFTFNPKKKLIVNTDSKNQKTYMIGDRLLKKIANFTKDIGVYKYDDYEPTDKYGDVHYGEDCELFFIENDVLISTLKLDTGFSSYDECGYISNIEFNRG